jgi:GT2 family glycosyltransferase
MNPRTLGIVVVHFGDEEPTCRCLRSIVSDSSVAGRRIVVVDNSAGVTRPISVDAVRLAARPLEVGIVSAPDNPGFGGGANRGVEWLVGRCRFRALVILNHDVELLPGFLDAADRALTCDAVGAAGGPIHHDRADGPLWYAGGRLRTLTGTVVQRRSPEAARLARDVGFVPGAAIAVSGQAWENVGGFDPEFFLYHEDLDLCLRLRRAGWRLRFEPGMRSVHHLGAATGSARRSALYLEEMAATRLRPHRSRLYRLYLAGLHTPYVLLQALRLRLEDREGGASRARALLAGHRRALTHLFD